VARAQQGDRVRRIGMLMLNENDPAQKTYVSAFTQALAGLGWTDGRNLRMDVRWGRTDINRIRALAQELVGLQPDIDSRSPEAERESVPAFRQGLAEIGYVEGRNVVVDYRWAENDIDRLPALAADLVRRRVAVIVALGTTSALAAKAVTQTIPIVFRAGSDPVEIGLVATFNRPAGNLTGVANFSGSMVSKRLALLHELLPSVMIATLVNPANPRFAQIETRDLQAAAGVLGVRVLVLNGGTASDIAGAFATLVEQQAGALLISADAWFLAARDQITSLAARYAIPTMFSDRTSAIAGGLLSYGFEVSDVNRQVGVYAGRILKGEKPADLPVQQPTKFELVINLKTAKALGLTIPETLLATADEVIQ
jgi:putative ABC transport system substrate-binding protein